ncbi:hypothetical protein [Absidia glauca]|uniref:Uncharacterized protein n=1 Tax=Absidia glauca TaxID=4829 RepID=A0A163KRY7_ABSGL|nr:hypothetical protein [Absidia glauca]
MGKFSSTICPICLVPTKTINQRKKHAKCRDARLDQPGPSESSSQQSVITTEPLVTMAIDMEDDLVDFDFDDGATTASLNTHFTLSERNVQQEWL